MLAQDLCLYVAAFPHTDCTCTMCALCRRTRSGRRRTGRTRPSSSGCGGSGRRRPRRRRRTPHALCPRRCTTGRCRRRRAALPARRCRRPGSSPQSSGCGCTFTLSLRYCCGCLGRAILVTESQTAAPSVAVWHAADPLTKFSCQRYCPHAVKDTVHVVRRGCCTMTVSTPWGGPLS